MAYKKVTARGKRKVRIRKKITGTPDRPRMSVFKSNKYLYVQVIDDLNRKTIVSANTMKEGKGANVASAKWIGEAIATKAKSANVETVIFDRNGFKYHGVVKQIADSARENGLKF